MIAPAMITMPIYSNLADMLTQRAQGGGRAIYATFISDNGRVEEQMTFQELDRDARRLGAALQEQGLAGRNLLLLFLPGLNYIRAFFGCLYAGAVPVPAYPPVGAKDRGRLQKIALDCGAGAFLANKTMEPLVASWNTTLEDNRAVPCLALEGLLSAGNGADFVPHQAAPDDLAFLQYTSGSTGHPKGVMVSHGNLLANFAQILQGCLQDNPLVDRLEDLRSVIWLPPFHDMGLIGGVLAPIFAGAQVTLMAPLTFLKRPALWLQTIAQQRAHISGAPNFAYDYCVRKITDAQLERLDLSRWKVAFNGAEPVQADTLQRFAARFQRCGFDLGAFFACYGLAEATLFVSGSSARQGAGMLWADQDQLQRGRFAPAEPMAPNPGLGLVSCGRVAHGTDVKIVQPETRLPCADNEVGEIWVRGPSVAQGYWAKLHLSVSTFQARLADEPRGATWLRTGDLGFCRDGELFVTGRIKEMIILAGRNLCPQDIELALQDSSPAFRGRGGAAFSVSEDGREQLVILQEVNRNFSKRNDLRLIAAYGARAVASRHGVMPTAVVLLPANTIPRTSSGKLQRLEARRLYREGSIAPLHVWQSGIVRTLSALQSFCEPAADTLHQDWRTELGNDVQLWVAERLDVEMHHVDLNVTFFDLGVDSVEAMELVERLQDRIGRAIPPIELLRYPTVSSLLDHLAEERMRQTLHRLELEEAVEVLAQ